ncbi:hypothetical protein ACQJBY_031587 [Aegilops geniculata]
MGRLNLWAMIALAVKTIQGSMQVSMPCMVYVLQINKEVLVVRRIAERKLLMRDWASEYNSAAFVVMKGTNEPPAQTGGGGGGASKKPRIPGKFKNCGMEGHRRNTGTRPLGFAEKKICVI